VCKYNGGTVEFKIPFGECMNLYQGKLLKYLRVDIQDSKNSWGVTGDIRVENYSIGIAHIEGDVNADGVFNLVDILVLKKWLLNDDVTLSDRKAGDFTDDDKLDVFDFCLMKQRYLEKM
jgi:hypothetical protein